MSKEEQFTPGPWRLAGSDKHPLPVVTSLHPDKGYQIHSMAHVEGASPDVWRFMRNQYIADARLIAAAPELLAACQAALRPLEVLTESDAADLHALADSLRAAIAKALGAAADTQAAGYRPEAERK